MADYDWFRPTAAQEEAARVEREWRKENHITSFKTSTAVGTELYGCTQCGTMLLSKGYVETHREFYHPKPVAFPITPPRCQNCKAYVWPDQEHACRK